MTRKLNPAQGFTAGATLHAFAQKFTRILIAVCLTIQLGAVAAPVYAANDTLCVELRTNETITITLPRAMAPGATVTVDLNPAYAAQFPGCGFGASLTANNDKIILTLPGGSCTPGYDLECAVITAVKWDGTVAAAFSVARQDGHWEVVDQEL